MSSIGYSFSSGAGNRVKELGLKPVKDAAIFFFFKSSLLATLLESVLKDINVRACFATRLNSVCSCVRWVSRKLPALVTNPGMGLWDAEYPAESEAE